MTTIPTFREKSTFAASLMKVNIRQFTMIFALLAIWVIFTVLTDFVFLTPRNISNLMLQTATTAILAIGMVLVIVTGNIDLSVGSTLGFTGAVAAMLMIKFNMDIYSTILLTLLVGIVIGAWHGYWVAYRKVPAFIVTLASMLIFRGSIIGLTGGQTQGLEMAPPKVAQAFAAVGQQYLPKISAKLPFNDTSLYFSLACIVIFIIFALYKRNSRIKYGFKVLPLGLELLKLAALSILIAVFASFMILYLGIPYAVLLVLIFALLFNFLANNTSFGRHLYAIGGNAEAARFSGINIAKATFILFVIMGALYSVAGIVYTARLNAATTSAGTNAELDAIAASVIGGTSLMGGEGSIMGALIGALVMASLDNGMSLMNLDITFQYVIKGLILLIAVGVDIATRQKSA
ncbi:MAG: sugar ABC transporter permease [Bacillota bacterium]